MSVETERILIRLLGRVPVSAAKDSTLRDQGKKPDKGELTREKNSKARNLHRRLDLFHRLMTHEKIGNNRINLGTNPETIDWETMPPEVAAYFQPEFDYQPEDITDFFITSKDYRHFNGELSILISLCRRDQWWSYVSAGVKVRRDYRGEATYVGCLAPSAQPKAAREARESLERSLWGDALGSDDQELPFLFHALNGLQLADAVLGFATTQLERQLAAPTIKS